MITLTDYWMGRDKKYPCDLTDTIRANAAIVVDRANVILTEFRQATGDTEQRKVVSGWRPPLVNASTKGAALRSNHMTGQAIDISDPEGDLDEWCLHHLDRLALYTLWMEHPSATKGWCHLQIVPQKSFVRTGLRYFYP